MDGKFTNTEVVRQLDTITNSTKERLVNPFYNFIQEKGTVVTYYAIDKLNYPLDKVTGMQYASIGELAHAKYNKINDFILYGIDQIPTTMLEDTDFGTEGAEVSGNAIALPNTIEPYPGDFFTINYMQDKVLFRVVEVNSDTFGDGSNLYQVDYKLEHATIEDIEQYNIGVESQFLLNNIGTQYTSVLEIGKYNVVKRIEEVLGWMRKYYKNLFFNDRVQSLIFSNSAHRFYDSFLTEFVKQNKLLQDRKDYVYIDHQLNLPSTFELDYSRSFFQCIQDKNSKKFRSSTRIAFGELIDSKMNIFSNRPEPYLNMNYQHGFEEIHENISPGLVFEIFDTVLLKNIADNELFGDDILSDIIIKYFNDRDITEEDLDELETYDYKNCLMQFYYVPIAMFILEYYIKQYMLIQK